MIYADNAATTKMSEAAVHTMISVINENYGNPSSLYSIGQQAKETLEEARKTVAEKEREDAYHLLRFRASRGPAHAGAVEEGRL